MCLYYISIPSLSQTHFYSHRLHARIETGPQRKYSVYKTRKYLQCVLFKKILFHRFFGLTVPVQYAFFNFLDFVLGVLKRYAWHLNGLSDKFFKYFWIIVTSDEIRKSLSFSSEDLNVCRMCRFNPKKRKEKEN